MNRKPGYPLPIIITLLMPVLMAIAGQVEIGVLGEMTFTAEMEPLLEEKGAEYPFFGIREILAGTNIALGFLNSPITMKGDSESERDLVFRSPMSVARGLARAGVKIVSLATPHIMDYGTEGLIDTIDALDWYGVKSVGAGSNIDLARQPIIIEEGGSRIAFLAYLRGDQFTERYADVETPGPCPLSPEIIEEDIPRAREIADGVVVMVHWGIGGGSESVTDKQRFWTRMMIELGATAVIGQEAHRLHGIELVDGKPIIYSLADFIFGTSEKAHDTTVLGLLTFDGNAVRNIRFVPIDVDNERTEFAPRPLNGDPAKSTMRKFGDLSKMLGTAIKFDGDRIIVPLGR